MEYAAHILSTLVMRNAIALSNGEIWWSCTPDELSMILSFRDAITQCGVALIVQPSEEQYLVGLH